MPRPDVEGILARAKQKTLNPGELIALEKWIRQIEQDAFRIPIGRFFWFREGIYPGEVKEILETFSADLIETIGEILSEEKDPAKQWKNILVVMAFEILNKQKKPGVECSITAEAMKAEIARNPDKLYVTDGVRRIVFEKPLGKHRG
jgi:hypothetical protein